MVVCDTRDRHRRRQRRDCPGDRRRYQSHDRCASCNRFGIRSGNPSTASSGPSIRRAFSGDRRPSRRKLRGEARRCTRYRPYARSREPQRRVRLDTLTETHTRRADRPDKTRRRRSSSRREARGASRELGGRRLIRRLTLRRRLPRIGLSLILLVLIRLLHALHLRTARAHRLTKLVLLIARQHAQDLTPQLAAGAGVTRGAFGMGL
jgi:hypothetical protein